MKATALALVLDLTPALFAHTCSLSPLPLLAFSFTPSLSSGDPLLLVPLMSVPGAKILLHLTWKLPGGRNPLFHHVFPVIPYPERGGLRGQSDPSHSVPRQQPVDVVGMMKATALAVALDLTFSSGVGCVV